jgi:hypothetical protein
VKDCAVKLRYEDGTIVVEVIGDGNYHDGDQPVNTEEFAAALGKLLREKTREAEPSS